MIEKFVVYNPTTKEYFKRGYGKTEDPAKARIYNRPNHAKNSMRRKRWMADGFDVFPINAEFPMQNGPMDTLKAVNDGICIPFQTVVDYFRQLYFIDITGNLPLEFPLCTDIIDVFYKKLRHIPNFSNNDNFIVTEKTFETDKPLQAMVGAEIIKMFGYDTQGKRIAQFKIDWFDEEGERRKD